MTNKEKQELIDKLGSSPAFRTAITLYAEEHRHKDMEFLHTAFCFYTLGYMDAIDPPGKSE